MMADGSPYPRWGSQGLMVNVTATETHVVGKVVSKTSATGGRAGTPDMEDVEAR